MSSGNNIFISWSGDHSRRVAEALRSWLPNLIDGLSLWISSRDLPEGRGAKEQRSKGTKEINHEYLASQSQVYEKMRFLQDFFLAILSSSLYNINNRVAQLE